MTPKRTRKEAHGMDAAQLGAALRTRRRELDLTQSETADLADVSIRVLSDLENGRETVRLDILSAVADALGLSLNLGVQRP
ncbi:helix-turn-helix domain-containing protein [Arthrobacter livingstonensis]|nr:helix-turn-helix domain-containing protein [Arthrobacter livingstonensis]